MVLWLRHIRVGKVVATWDFHQKNHPCCCFVWKKSNSFKSHPPRGKPGKRTFFSSGPFRNRFFFPIPNFFWGRGPALPLQTARPRGMWTLCARNGRNDCHPLWRPEFGTLEDGLPGRVHGYVVRIGPLIYKPWSSAIWKGRSTTRSLGDETDHHGS